MKKFIIKAYLLIHYTKEYIKSPVSKQAIPNINYTGSPKSSRTRTLKREKKKTLKVGSIGSIETKK